MFCVNYCDARDGSQVISHVNALHAICSAMFKIVKTIKGIKGVECKFPRFILANGLNRISFFHRSAGTQFIPLSVWFVRGASLSKLTNEKWPLEEAIFPECYYTSMHFQINNPSELPPERRLPCPLLSASRISAAQTDFQKRLPPPNRALYNKYIGASRCNGSSVIFVSDTMIYHPSGINTQNISIGSSLSVALR